MTDKKYNIIYADPPWRYANKKTGGSMKSGAEAHYETMSIKEICDMPIRKLVAKDAVLFLWVTTPLLPECFEVLKAWGFKYKTMITWRKIMSLGLGYWFRGQTEHVLVASKGNIKAFRLQEANFIQCKSEKHSKKPEIFRELINRATKNIENPVRLELFARQESVGWDVFGNEVLNSIEI